MKEIILVFLKALLANTFIFFKNEVVVASYRSVY